MAQSLDTVQCGHAPFICSLSSIFRDNLSYIHMYMNIGGGGGGGGQKVKQAHDTSIPNDCVTWVIA